MRLPSGFPDYALPRGWNWCWYGYASNLEDPRGIPRPDDGYILCGSFAKGIRHRCGTVQRYSFRAPIGREFG